MTTKPTKTAATTKTAAKRKPATAAPLAVFARPKSAAERTAELQTVAVMAAAEARAISLGLDWAVFQKYIVRFGPEIIDLAESLVVKGFTAEFIYEAIEKLTPDILAVLRELLTGEPSVDVAAADGAQQFLFPGSSILIRIAAKKIVAALKEKLPPNLRALVDQYADDLIEVIVGVLG